MRVACIVLEVMYVEQYASHERRLFLVAVLCGSRVVNVWHLIERGAETLYLVPAWTLTAQRRDATCMHDETRHAPNNAKALFTRGPHKLSLFFKPPSAVRHRLKTLALPSTRLTTWQQPSNFRRLRHQYSPNIARIAYRAAQHAGPALKPTRRR